VFDVVRKSAIPLADQLVARVSELIESGRLPAGSRLPSVRQLARRVGVSVYTVTSAFERLAGVAVGVDTHIVAVFAAQNLPHGLFVFL